jgi:CRP-like cAMP-binding protein/membrane protein YdbS with pleckstrin-like domain
MSTSPPSPDALAVVIPLLVPWGLPADEAAYALHGAVTWRYLAPRDPLFVQDARVDAIYFLLSGKLFQERIVQHDGVQRDGVQRDGVQRDSVQRRATLRREAQAGEWLGHYDLLFTQHYSTRARALAPCWLIAVQAAPLSRLISRYPRVRERMAPLEKIGRLRTVPAFGRLDLTTLAYVADACQAVKHQANTQLYTADDPATDFMVVDHGQVLLRRPGERDLGVGNGMAFGYLDTAISPQVDPPPAYGHAAITTVPSIIFTFPRRTLFELTNLTPETIAPRLRALADNALAQVTVFSDYSAEERQTLLGYMSHYHIPIHHLVMQQGEVGDSLWVLMPDSQATLYALESGQALHPTRVQGPNFFGELALRVEHTLKSTVQAEPGSHWLRLHMDDFRAFLRDHGYHFQARMKLSPEAAKRLGREHARQRYGFLMPEENLILFQRRHPLALFKKVFFSLTLSTLLIITWLLLNSQGWLSPPVYWLIGLLGTVSLAQFSWGIADHFNDWLLVTNQRLVRQEKVLFINEWRQAAFLEQIRNIDVASDFLGNLFQYGEVNIRTAASSGSINFDFVPNPARVRQTILEQQSARQQHYQASSKLVIQNILEDRFGLRLHLPSRVLPVVAAPTIRIAQTWRERARAFLNFTRHLEIRTADRIVWRKHWFMLLGRLSPPGFVLLVILAILIGQAYIPDDLRRLITPLGIALALLGLIMAGWAAWIVTDWRNDTYEIDSKQIADVEKKPLFFSEQRRTALLGEIENIEVNIPSPLHYLLNFGNVRLQTAASQGEFSFDWVPDPRGVAEEVRRRIEIYRYEQETNRARQRAQELPDWFEMYNRLGADSILPQPRLDS